LLFRIFNLLLIVLGCSGNRYRGRFTCASSTTLTSLPSGMRPTPTAQSFPS